MDSPQVELARAFWIVYGSAGILFLVVAVATFLVFRLVSTKWLEAKFAERLESYKHAQQVEIENARYKINSLFDRSTRIHIKEYEYLPSIWVSLNEAYRSALFLAGGFRQYPNLYSVSDHELERLLSFSELNDFEKDKLRAASNKMTAWIDVQNIRELNKARKDHHDFRINLGKYAIFFNEDIQVELIKFADVIWDAIIEFEIYKIDMIDGEKPERKAREELRANGGARLKALERKVRDRLWSANSSSL